MKKRNRINSIKGIIYFYLLAYVIRAPTSIILNLLRISIFILLLTLIGGYNFFKHAIIGALIALSFGAGLSQFSVDINAMRVSRFKDIIVSSPVGPLTYAFGTAIGMSLLSGISLCIFLVIWYMIFRPLIQVIIIIAGVLLVTWIVGILLGFMVSTYIKTPHILFNITDVLYSILIYAMPVYYPITSLPNWIRPLTYISPATHAAIITRELSELGQISSYPSLITLILLSIAMILIVRMKAKWVE